MPFFFVATGQVPKDPVVSKKSGLVFEKEYVEKVFFFSFACYFVKFLVYCNTSFVSCYQWATRNNGPHSTSQ